jgi:hypothetical protein
MSSIHQLIGYDFSKLTPNSVIYICAAALPHFIQEVAAFIPFQYVLVTGDCDEVVPHDLFLTESCFFSESHFLQFMDSPQLIHWFSQNCVCNCHPKLSQIPIGLDYHTLSGQPHKWGDSASPVEQEKVLTDIVAQARPFYERECKAYANYHFFMTTRFGQDRHDAKQQVPEELVFYEATEQKRADTWRTQTQYAFVISPHGNGLDCHRTWEALVLGCIPIVKTSPLNPLFADLPVLIVNEWSDVCPSLLETTCAKYRTTSFSTEKLELAYWTRKIRSLCSK